MAGHREPLLPSRSNIPTKGVDETALTALHSPPAMQLAWVVGQPEATPDCIAEDRHGSSSQRPSQGLALGG